MGFTGKAQNIITGKVLEAAEIGIPFASVALLNANDSSIVKGAITGEDGIYKIRSIPTGNYFLSVTFIGYEKFIGSVFLFSGGTFELEPITLVQSVQALNEVTVSGKRQVLERKTDRYVMDVTASTFQSDNIMDIFYALPFVQVKSDGISVNGKGGILILLDKVQMPQASLNSILTSMTGDEIENIEFITNPSSRYPSDISTVIKITTKRSKYYGLTGSARTALSQGIYGKASLGTSLTYRKKKWVTNINLNQRSGSSFTETNNERILNIDGNQILLDGDYKTKNVYNKPSLRAAIDYTINKSNSIGLQSNVNYTKTSRDSFFKNSTDFISESGTVDSVLRMESFDFGSEMIQNYSMYYNHKLDTLGKSVDFIFTYTPVNINDGTEMLYQRLLTPTEEVLSELPIARNTNRNQANIFVGQMDWELPFQNGLRLITGGKVTKSVNDTKPAQDIKVGNQFIGVEDFTFQNKFQESILAYYTDINKAFGERINISAGLRMEYSRMIVDNLTANQRELDREFTDFFPNVRVDYFASQMLQLSANYRRTIQRPGFSTLTPFRNYVDDYTIIEGNPGLLPAYENTVSVNMILGGMLYVEAAYSDQKDSYTQLPRADGDVTIWRDTNFDLTSYSLLGNMGFQITNWWTGSVFAYGALMESAIGQEGFNIIDIPLGIYHTFGLENSFNLPAGLKLETTINYTGPVQLGLVEAISNNYTRLALKGSLFNDKLNYTLSAMDFFRGDMSGANINSYNMETRVKTYSDARRIQLGLVYRFGKNTVREARNKELGNEDVVNRVD